MPMPETRRATALVAAMGIVAIVLMSFGAVRLAVLSALALTAPGVALTFAFFPRGRLRVAERVLLTVGLSLATIVVVTAALGESSVFLDRTTIVLALTLVTALAVLVTIARLVARSGPPAQAAVAARTTAVAAPSLAASQPC